MFRLRPVQSAVKPRVKRPINQLGRVLKETREIKAMLAKLTPDETPILLFPQLSSGALSKHSQRDIEK